MASEWGPIHDSSHSTGPAMTFTMFHTRLMGPVTAVTFAGAGPQTGRRGPREPQAAIVPSPRKPASLCQTCFSVCFLFYVFNVAKERGVVMFLQSSTPSQPLSPALLLSVTLTRPLVPIFLLFPKSIQISLLPLHQSSPWILSLVKCFAWTAHIFVAVLRLPSHSAPFYLYFMRFWHFFFLCWNRDKERKKKAMYTTPKQLNFSLKEFSLSHTESIFLHKIIQTNQKQNRSE